MKKLRKTVLAGAAALVFAASAAAVLPEIPVAAEELKSYSTGVRISQQGEDGVYYAWGTPEHYVLMDYGVHNSGYGWHGLELYCNINGSSLHPGNFWGVLVVWVAGESGTVSLSGEMQKGSTNGDGVNLGVFHQHADGELEVLLEEFVDGTGELNYPLDKELEIKRGDSLIFWCDSGKGKDNNSDSVGCPFTIAYIRTEGDAAEEDLSIYLHAGRPGDVGGFQHIEQDFAAEVLDGTLTEKKYLETGGCASSASAAAVLAVGALALIGLGRKRK